MALRKTIGLWSATSIVIGSVVGSTIFIKPATMASQLGSPLLLIIVWLVAGIITFFGGMVYAELGSMYPETGGQYVYLQKMYGDFVAFLYGWSTIAVINTAAIAAISFVCAKYLGFFIHLPRFSPGIEHSVKWHIPGIADIFPLEDAGVKAVAILIVFILTIVNYVSVRYGNAIQFIATLVKVLVIIFLVVGILFSGQGDLTNLVTRSSQFHLSGWALLAAFMAATTGAFASYDGWVNINMVAGEIKDPQKNLTKSLLFGLVICILIYVCMNFAYMYALPIDTMSHSSLVASDATEKVLGRMGGAIVALLIVVSAFGATNINLLTNARIVFAMGQDGTFFRWSGKIHPRYQTPGNSVVIIATWSCLFVISGSFDILADMFVFMAWVFYGLTVAGIFILRKKFPDYPRPYRIRGYPFIPIIFALFTLFYVLVNLFNDIDNYRTGKSTVVNSVVGLLLTLAGVPIYWYLKRKAAGASAVTES
ncbi:MAG: hypothetical protein C5B59_01315 [Bacteroidetes bacterium]|nr:MAG: hypothetical protein C5B59_01315 [Bacteroidota bacterium]